jgi:hypothetical protein
MVGGVRVYPDGFEGVLTQTRWHETRFASSNKLTNWLDS